MISEDKPILIFDLDGTILSADSYRMWVKYMLYGRFPKISLFKRIKVFVLSALAQLNRKVFGAEHFPAKRRMQKIWSDAADDSALDLLIPQLMLAVRPELKDILSTQTDAILTTAAAAEYAKPLGQKLGFKHILSTPCHPNNFVENMGQKKCDVVLAYISAQSWQGRKRIFFTDHEDDLSLIQQSQIVYWFGSKEKIPFIKNAAPDTKILNGFIPNALAQLHISS